LHLATDVNAEDRSILRVAFRVSARAGLHRFQDHRLSRATKKVAQCGGRDQSAASDENRTKFTFAD
jgi:hypothetical protein